jgi:hypothetical protein
MIPQTPQIAMPAKKENDGMGLCLRERIRHSIFFCLALVTMCSLFLLTTVTVQADSVTIHDQAGVLDVGMVQAEAAKLPAPLLIYTTKTFTGDLDALNQSTRAQLPNQDAIAIGIDTVHRNVSIEAGTNVSLSDSQASDAVSAFRSDYDNGGDYTSATIAALDSIRNTYTSISNEPPVLIVLWFIGFIGGTVGIVVWGKRGGSSVSGGHGGGGSHGGGAGGHF